MSTHTTARDLSLVSLGARLQFDIALVLTSVIPALALAYLDTFDGIPFGAKVAIGVSILILVVAGYVMLLKYPRTILQLRRYLENLAKGELPASVVLTPTESDIAAVEKYVNLIIEQTRERIATIERQREELLASERQRVVTESMCAACHCLGQPATVLSLNLGLLSRHTEVPEPWRNTLKECVDASDRLNTVLHKLQHVREYRSETYWAGDEATVVTMVAV
jgi:methyl-accepting chemotaxis protein